MSALLPILDQPAAPGENLVGIARLAAQGEHIDDGHNVEYFTLHSKSLLNRCTSARMPFTWTVNPYRGCEFACKYCYARYTHEFMEMSDLDFERKIYVKQQAAGLLRRDLRKVKPGQDIAIGTATDPYQPAERRYCITQAVLEELALHRGLEIGIVTKSVLIVRDVELLKRVAEHNDLSINLTVTTLNTELARILEPRAPRPDLRLEALHKLTSAGLHAGVICAPVLPRITDSRRDLETLVKATAEAGGKFIYSNVLFLKPCSESIFMPFLAEKFPHLVDYYRARYADKAFLPSAYKKSISALIRKYAAKYGLGERFDAERETKTAALHAAQVPEQLSLF